ncbi:MAG: phenylalanine--tRNA ligase subunit alpha [Cytophagia bacterium]|nr:MAG: phenylalanine--tRNA ligase subunit alpha [Cytophagales bacterium]TAG37776.1 MAG: phenylalanine--tRNA ligase subunit alpha [Cytophagia bacterium]TAG50793.1 MAG: phenylalanine--tRNA ligase subunit alpha [Runella slithyformis]TAG69257.1 MAG: phenylalanine--tRNA ligase subunit alpha [Runella slithyformis]TAG78995.1 MAG: phenylalanine--tRNA ligase subunit alpha [Cytophagales bacterium]
MSLIEQARAIYQEIEAMPVGNKEQLEQFRIRFIGRKGAVEALFEGLKDVAKDDRRAVGQELNTLKNFAHDRFVVFQGQLESADGGVAAPVDLTLPVFPHQLGSIHPLTLARAKIIEIFERMGFSVADGPEIESDWYNFTALNFPENHPAREMQDTFFVEKHPEDGTQDMLLRTHTSNVQIRLMQQQKPPFRAIMPGRVYRNEAISARAHCFFHQVEGLYVDKNVSFKDLKDTLYHFSKEMFSQDVKIRLRPSFFPFTEPSAEIDIWLGTDTEETYRLSKGTGWVEIAGSGMVDPNVLANCGIDPEEYTGFAFGMGVERIAQLRYGVRDLRLYSENDVRFLRQFEGI